MSFLRCKSKIKGQGKKKKNQTLAFSKLTRLYATLIMAPLNHGNTGYGEIISQGEMSATNETRARKVGFNTSGSWQGGTSQTIVKGQVFFRPAATVHWHFHKKDYWANRNRVQEGEGSERKTMTAERGTEQ